MEEMRGGNHFQNFVTKIPIFKKNIQFATKYNHSDKGETHEILEGA